MTKEIKQGIAVALVCIFIVVTIGMGIGFACSPDEPYPVDPPEGLEEAAPLPVFEEGRASA